TMFLLLCDVTTPYKWPSVTPRRQSHCCGLFADSANANSDKEPRIHGGSSHGRVMMLVTRIH
ncbi:unnamed protein product, partial [Ceratitis capitata]